MTKRKNRKAPRKEEIGEDYCFVCKDGGDLRICDHKQCVKAYHYGCVGQNESFLKSQKNWICNRHFCFVCEKASHFHCYYCPKAVCLHCISDAEFVNFKGKYGFCDFCLKLAILVEEERDVDSDGEKVDFDNCDTYEGLFKGYYMISKEKQGLDVDNLRAAKDRFIAGKHLLSDSDSGEFDDDEDEAMISDYDSMEDIRDYKPPCKKKAKLSAPRKNAKSNSLKFSGWGSAPLITFLSEIGADTEKKLSQFEVSGMINKYINDRGLYHFEKKKKRKIVCDEKLRSIFRKKTLKHNRIYDLLEVHFAENLEESEEEEAVCYSTDDDFVQDSATRLESKTEKGFPRKEAKLGVPPSSFASIAKQNINLVFLRRSLVQVLSDHPEFENKIIGSFVRVKTDRNDIGHKFSHHLVRVTGVMEFSSTGDKSEIILYVTSIPKEISIKLLSDADFPEEECEELRQKMKDGILPQPTVGELEKKARLLHQDITNDWIARELKKLGPLIDLANEKGRRREFDEYWKRRESLQSPSEQKRLLETYPTVIPEATEVETGGGDAGNWEESDKASSKLNVSDVLNDNITSKETKSHTPDPVHEISVAPQISESLTLEEQSQQVLTPAPVQETRANLRRCDSAAVPSPPVTNVKQNQQNDVPNKFEKQKPLAVNSKDLSNEKESLTLEEQPQQIFNPAPGEESRPISPCASTEHSLSATSRTQNQLNDPTPEKFKKQEPMARNAVELSSNGDDQDPQKNDVAKKVKKQEALANNVIELSSSDDEDESRATVRRPISEDPESEVWMIVGPRGHKRGPSSLSLLRKWKKACTEYALQCKAWKVNESEDDAIPLGEALSLAFHDP